MEREEGEKPEHFTAGITNEETANQHTMQCGKEEGREPFIPAFSFFLAKASIAVYKINFLRPFYYFLLNTNCVLQCFTSSILWVLFWKFCLFLTIILSCTVYVRFDPVTKRRRRNMRLQPDDMTDNNKRGERRREKENRQIESKEKNKEQRGKESHSLLCAKKRANIYFPHYICAGERGMFGNSIEKATRVAKKNKDIAGNGVLTMESPKRKSNFFQKCAEFTKNSLQPPKQCNLSPQAL